VRKQLPALLLFGAFAIALVGGGIYVLVRQHSGVPVTVTVTGCTTARATQGGSVCSGSWTLDGRTVTGEIEGSGDAEVGDEIAARATGTRAYTPSPRLPIILISLGVLLPAGAYWEAARGSARAAEAEAAPA
jgi:hypothetical protein